MVGLLRRTVQHMRTAVTQVQLRETDGIQRMLFMYRLGLQYFLDTSSISNNSYTPGKGPTISAFSAGENIDTLSSITVHTTPLQSSSVLFSYSTHSSNGDGCCYPLPIHHFSMLSANHSVRVKFECSSLAACVHYRQLKKVLQFAENLSSQTASSRNRWEEAHQLCHSLMITVSKSLPLFHHQTQK